MDESGFRGLFSRVGGLMRYAADRCHERRHLGLANTHARPYKNVTGRSFLETAKGTR